MGQDHAKPLFPRLLSLFPPSSTHLPRPVSDSAFDDSTLPDGLCSLLPPPTFPKPFSRLDIISAAKSSRRDVVRQMLLEKPKLLHARSPWNQNSLFHIASANGDVEMLWDLVRVLKRQFDEKKEAEEAERVRRGGEGTGVRNCEPVRRGGEGEGEGGEQGKEEGKEGKGGTTGSREKKVNEEEAKEEEIKEAEGAERRKNEREERARRWLLEFRKGLKAQLQCRNNRGSTPLLVAATAGKKASIETLIRLGSCMWAVDNDTYTALHQACRRNHVACVAALLDFPAPAQLVRSGTHYSDARTRDGWTALHLAVATGHHGCVIELLKRNASILIGLHINRGMTSLNTTWPDVAPGSTALHVAAIRKDVVSIHAVLLHFIEEMNRRFRRERGLGVEERSAERSGERSEGSREQAQQGVRAGGEKTEERTSLASPSTQVAFVTPENGTNMTSEREITRQDNFGVNNASTSPNRISATSSPSTHTHLMSVMLYYQHTPLANPRRDPRDVRDEMGRRPYDVALMAAASASILRLLAPDRNLVSLREAILGISDTAESPNLRSRLPSRPAKKAVSGISSPTVSAPTEPSPSHRLLRKQESLLDALITSPHRFIRMKSSPLLSKSETRQFGRTHDRRSDQGECTSALLMPSYELSSLHPAQTSPFSTPPATIDIISNSSLLSPPSSFPSTPTTYPLNSSSLPSSLSYSHSPTPTSSSFQISSSLPPPSSFPPPLSITTATTTTTTYRLLDERLALLIMTHVPSLGDFCAASLRRKLLQDLEEVVSIVASTMAVAAMSPEEAAAAAATVTAVMQLNEASPAQERLCTTRGKSKFDPQIWKGDKLDPISRIRRVPGSNDLASLHVSNSFVVPKNQDEVVRQIQDKTPPLLSAFPLLSPLISFEDEFPFRKETATLSIPSLVDPLLTKTSSEAASAPFPSVRPSLCPSPSLSAIGDPSTSTPLGISANIIGDVSPSGFSSLKKVGWGVSEGRRGKGLRRGEGKEREGREGREEDVGEDEEGIEDEIGEVDEEEEEDVEESDSKTGRKKETQTTKEEHHDHDHDAEEKEDTEKSKDGEEREKKTLLLKRGRETKDGIISVEQDICAVCMGEWPDIQITPCRHFVCSGCARNLTEKLNSVSLPLPCPFCRTNIRAYNYRSFA